MKIYVVLLGLYMLAGIGLLGYIAYDIVKDEIRERKEKKRMKKRMESFVIQEPNNLGNKVYMLNLQVNALSEFIKNEFTSDYIFEFRPDTQPDYGTKYRFKNIYKVAIVNENVEKSQGFGDDVSKTIQLLNLKEQVVACFKYEDVIDYKEI